MTGTLRSFPTTAAAFTSLSLYPDPGRLGRQKALDDVILPLFERSRNGEALTQDLWLDAVRKELGPSAKAEFEFSILRVEDDVPAYEAFGPEFERVPVMIHRLELGFDEGVLKTPEKYVTGQRRMPAEVPGQARRRYLGDRVSAARGGPCRFQMGPQVWRHRCKPCRRLRRKVLARSVTWAWTRSPEIAWTTSRAMIPY